MRTIEVCVHKAPDNTGWQGLLGFAQTCAGPAPARVHDVIKAKMG